MIASACPICVKLKGVFWRGVPLNIDASCKAFGSSKVEAAELNSLCIRVLEGGLVSMTIKEVIIPSSPASPEGEEKDGRPRKDVVKLLLVDFPPSCGPIFLF